MRFGAHVHRMRSSSWPAKIRAT